MMVHAKWSVLRQSRWYEYLLRLVLGGGTTALAGLVADHWGPAIGGLFLAFPAIFCASATLIEKHERDRKKKHGLEGHRRGTDATALDASGAAMGSLGMAAFAVTIWFTAPTIGMASLFAGSLVWILASITCWYCQRHIRHFRRSDSDISRTISP
jgi:hypothetical protein